MNQIEQESLLALLQQQPESLSHLIDTISPAIHENLKTAIELGKWADGNRLSSAQLEHCMQVVILYESANLPEEQRTGSALPNNCASKQSEEAVTLVVKDSSEQSPDAAKESN